jgi:PilZ domain
VSRNPVRRDSRKQHRATLEVPVVVRDAASRTHVAVRFEQADVSTGGAFLRSDLLLEIGDVLTIDFDLPGGRHVSARGRVVRVASGSGPRDPHAGMGVEFIELASDDQAAIQERL